MSRPSNVRLKAVIAIDNEVYNFASHIIYLRKIRTTRYRSKTISISLYKINDKIRVADFVFNIYVEYSWPTA